MHFFFLAFLVIATVFLVLLICAKQLLKVCFFTFLHLNFLVNPADLLLQGAPAFLTQRQFLCSAGYFMIQRFDILRQIFQMRLVVLISLTADFLIFDLLLPCKILLIFLPAHSNHLLFLLNLSLFLCHKLFSLLLIQQFVLKEQIKSQIRKLNDISLFRRNLLFQLLAQDDRNRKRHGNRPCNMRQLFHFFLGQNQGIGKKRILSHQL